MYNVFVCTSVTKRNKLFGRAGARCMHGHPWRTRWCFSSTCKKTLALVQHVVPNGGCPASLAVGAPVRRSFIS